MFKKIKTNIPRVKQIDHMENIIIHHYCPHTFNAGDHFVIKSIRKHLKEFLPNAVFIPKASANNRGWGKPVRLVGENIDFSNYYADAVVVGGSDQYNNWALRINGKEIENLIPPLYLIGLGISSKDINSPPHINKKSYFKDIYTTNLKAHFSSVRDQFTNEFLKTTGFNDAIVTGCPAMYLFDEPFEFNAELPVALTFPFPVVKKTNTEKFNKLIKLIKDMLDLTKKMGFDPIVVCHDDRDVIAASELFKKEKIFFSNYVDEFIEFYKKTSIIIGSRLHASILAAGLGKPFININIDARGEGFSKTFELTEWNLSFNDKDLISKLELKLNEIINNKFDLLLKFNDLKSDYKKIFRNFIKKVAEDIQQNLK